MLSTYQYPNYPYQRPPELDKVQDSPSHYPTVVVGAGPVGLAAAIELAQSGLPVLLLDNDNTVSIGSRGVCYAKRTLEILDRLGAGNAPCEKGVSWNIGRVRFRDSEVYHFDLLPQADHKRPAMINLQQYYLEAFLVNRAQELPNLEMRFGSRVTALSTHQNETTLSVETPEGTYQIKTDWLIAADGAKSTIRRLMNLEAKGQVFMDRFLIADVVMKADFPPERWFWFDPPFHRGQSVLLHRQADNVWRIDFQLGWDVDPEEEKKPEKVLPRIQAMLGEDHPFDLEWVSVYTFQCRRMKDFRHGRVLFVGDAAHQVSPFGARGANSGLQDTDNLCWKLKMVIEGKAPETLLDSYHQERSFAADENILNSTRSTDFITPKTPMSLTFRNSVLDLARKHDFARALVNSGRLSVPAMLVDSPLNTPDQDHFNGELFPGAVCADAPITQIQSQKETDGWLIDSLGNEFTLLFYLTEGSALTEAQINFFQKINLEAITLKPIIVCNQLEASLPEDMVSFKDKSGRIKELYDAKEGTIYLIRPDQHVAARWRSFSEDSIRAALNKASGQ